MKLLKCHFLKIKHKKKKKNSVTACDVLVSIRYVSIKSAVV